MTTMNQCDAVFSLSSLEERAGGEGERRPLEFGYWSFFGIPDVRSAFDVGRWCLGFGAFPSSTSFVPFTVCG
jgi:hypothetical protein